MEPSWEKFTGRNFALCEKYYPMANGVMKKQAVADRVALQADKARMIEDAAESPPDSAEFE